MLSCLTHLEYFCQTLGARPSGSEANNQSANYIAKYLKELTFDVLQQPFSAIKWKCHKAELIINDQSFDVLANGFSISCDLRAQVVHASNLSALEILDCTDKILLLYGDLTKQEIEPISSTYVAYVPLLSMRINILIQQKKPLAIILVAHDDRSYALQNDPDFTIPTVTVTAKIGIMLLKLPEEQWIRLYLKTTRSQTQASNIIAKLQGEQPETITLCAHFDTKFYTPGAYDNGAGISLLLTLADWISHQSWPCSFEIVAFNGEEIGPISGDYAYLNAYGLKIVPYHLGAHPDFTPVWQSKMLALNFDRIGLTHALGTVGAIACSPKLKSIIHEELTFCQNIVYKKPGPAGNHYTFYSHGVPAIFFSSETNINLAHTTDDTPQWISSKQLSDYFRLTCSLIKRIAYSDIKAFKL